MSKIERFILAMALVLASGILVVTPVADGDQEACAMASGDVAIVACSHAVTSGRYHGAQLSHLYVNRGRAYHAKHNYDYAVTDFSSAIALDSKNANAFFYRGLSHSTNGDFDRTMYDHVQALRLNPKYESAISDLGLLDWVKSYHTPREYDRSIHDFDLAARLSPI